MRINPSRPPEKKTWFTRCMAWWPIGLLLFILITLYALSGMKAESVAKARNAQRKEGPPPVNVVTLTVAPTVIRDRITLPGEVLADRELDVPAEVSAVLVKKTIKEGDLVQKGEVVARLDTSRYAARLQAAETAFNTARATARRLKNLSQTDLATQSDLDRAAASLEEARSALTTARLDLSKCEIKAPFSGHLDAYLVEKGAFVTMGTAICRLVDVSHVKVRVGVPESDVKGVRNPDSFSVYIDALGEDPIPGGSISRLGKAAGNLARLYDLDLLFPNEAGRMVPDMFARVELVKKRLDQALVVPLYAVLTRGDLHMVFVEENGTAVMKEVETGIQEGWMVEVTEGLEAGDRVIVVGQRSVSEGRKITVVRRAEKAEELLP